MAKFLMLIGLPGSGKTTYARNMLRSNKGWVHLSSDEITHRNRLPGEPVNHQQTFEEMHRETVLNLENGNPVIYDATNLASKRRKSLLNRIEKLGPETEAVVFLTPYELLKKRNSLRQAADHVPGHILDRYIRGFQLPRRDEKFDRIRFRSNPPLADINRKELKHQAFSAAERHAFFQSFAETKPMTETAEMDAIVRQQDLIIKEIEKEVPDSDEQTLLSWTVLLHNIGKPHVRKPVPIEQDNFYGYEHVSAYLAYPILLSLEFPLRFIYDALLLIDEYEIGKRLKRGKVKRRIGLKNYERLVILWEIMG